MTLTKTGDKAAVEGLQGLLSSCRQDLEQTRIASNKQSQEIAKLRDKIDELQVMLYFKFLCDLIVEILVIEP